MSREVLTGTYFMMGNFACAEGAIAAGCRFYAGYPITPSSEIAERMSRRLPEVEGHYVQMEDELGSMAAILGASSAGVKSMTATSGPGFSLMMENIGLGIIMEIPCVVVNVQRAGPSTGIPTLIGQGDMMQVRWGSHGDYETIAYVPDSPQEMFDLTVKAFDASEKYRLPVFVMADQIVAHMSGVVTIPKAEEIHVGKRAEPEKPPGSGFLPYPYDRDCAVVPPAGAGYHVNVDSLTHDEHGYPSTSQEVERRLLGRLLGKIRRNVSKIVEYEEVGVEDADVLVVAYGATSRSALRAVREARQSGIRAGLLRLITAWPFPADRVAELSRSVKTIVVPEINYGQMAHPVREFADCPVRELHHAPGSLIEPEKIVASLKES